MTTSTDAPAQTGRLIINADDWGRTADTTDRILACALQKRVSAVSAMVFMEDSERAARTARTHGLDAGLHLNFTSAFSDPGVPAEIVRLQARLIAYLRGHRLAQTVYHPGLAGAFARVVQAQREEFIRLYGTAPRRYDGHNHMHLCANVLVRGLLPAGAMVRRNFSFQPGEKSLLNRLYRRAVDALLARRHRLTDYFFSLPPLTPPARLTRIFGLAAAQVVEVETHPVNPEEFTFLTEGEALRYAGQLPIASQYDIPQRPPRSR
jgi:hypothetical protein